jgi:hypothetical protein
MMKSVSARFDGQRVLFDEEVEIRPHTRLLVTILEDVDQERAGFLALAATSLADAYGDDEVVYDEADLIPHEAR